MSDALEIGVRTYRTVAEIEEVLRRFEDCSYSPQEFVHARHLTVAAWYFVQFPAEVARERMRSGLRRFIAHHGKNGYHETITEFWLRCVEEAARKSHERDGDVVTRTNNIVANLNDKNLIYEYFSRERLGSKEAKARWLEPDLKAIA